MAEARFPSKETDGMRRFLTFRVALRLYALPAEDVVEIIRIPEVARVPQAPRALIGVANLRGRVLPLASVRALLGFEVAEVESLRAVVLEGAAPAAIAVDTVEALVTVAASQIETRQAALSAEPGEPLNGAFQVAGVGPAKILDVKALLDRAFAQRAQRERVTSARTLGAGRQEEHHDVSEKEVLVTFDVADQEYALALSSVQEVVPAPQAVVSMPHADAIVIGMMAFREKLLPLLSLRGLLGFAPAATSGALQKVMVTLVGRVTVGLVVDRARAVVTADRSLVEPTPAILAARSGGEARIKAIYRGDRGRRLISILAPEHLFREDVMRRLGTEPGAAAPKRIPTASSERQFLIFRLGTDEFGLPIEAVDEVARVPNQITRVPKTPKFLEGIVNFRGEALPIVDQRRRFDMPASKRSDGRRLIVVRSERHRAGLIVDSVSEVLRCSAETIQPPPILTDEITRLVHRIINLEDQNRIVLLLDPDELLTRAERGLLDAFERKAKVVS